MRKRPPTASTPAQEISTEQTTKKGEATPAQQAKKGEAPPLEIIL
jgi:hypothetical protein